MHEKWNGKFGQKNYVSGLLREDFVENYPNGNLKSSGILVNNVKIGSWSYWYQNERTRLRFFVFFLIFVQKSMNTLVFPSFLFDLCYWFWFVLFSNVFDFFAK